MLDKTLSYKPLDFGNGLVAGSINDQGRLISLNTFHPQQGYVTLTCLQPFPEDRRYDQQYVRLYRAKQASPGLPGFGLNFFSSGPGVCSIANGAAPQVELRPAPGITLDILTIAPWLKEGPFQGAIQLCTITNSRSEPVRLPFSWEGEVALTRSSYAQLTEGGPLARPADEYQVSRLDSLVTIANRGLGQAVAILVSRIGPETGEFKPQTGWQGRVGPVGNQCTLQLSGSVELAAGEVAQLVVIYCWGVTSELAKSQAQALARTNLSELIEKSRQRWEALDFIVQANSNREDLPGAGWLIRQTLTYILACCAVPVSPEATCLITDHQLLPLAWTRDTYYEVQALLALRQKAQPGDSETALETSDMVDRLVQQHLVWLFEVAERPDGFWGRSYLTNGKCKDPAFQLDQQCYPLLELADYLEITGNSSFAQRLRPYVEEIFATLLQRRASDGWLFPTSETPADDQVEMPYHLSSQIILWRLLSRLADLDILESYSSPQLKTMAALLQEEVYRKMSVDNGQGPLFCYLTDLQGNYRFYHDANDWPTILAPAWGFCKVDDPVWQGTLSFAFSPSNKGGFYPGRLAGLGSVHTPHPWPLGDLQELFLARLLQDKPRQIKIWTKLKQVACWDGNFPEAYDEESGQVVSRHWFAWPGAMLVSVLFYY